MRKRSSKIENDFRKDIPNSSNEQLIDILKKRDHYQQEAAELAIKEAIERGIICSEQDLFAQKYKVEELKTSLFPRIEKGENKQMIRRSIARSLLICGVMPVVYGLVQMNSSSVFEGAAILFFGLFWMASSAQLIRSFQNILVIFLIIESIGGFLYIAGKLLLKGNPVFMDFFIPFMLCMLVLYGLLFLKRCSD